MNVETQMGGSLDIPDVAWSRKDVRDLMLHRAVFSRKNMPGFLFDGSDLRSALLDSGFFSEASFRSVRAINALFRDSDLKGADFESASLVGAVFDGADLRGANFHEADVAFACFKNCDLRGANLRFTRSTDADFSGAKRD